MIEKCNIKDMTNVILEKIKSVSRPRNGWDDAFIEMHKNGDDKLLIDEILDDEIQEEWK